jgi:hypothetical protein
MGKTDDYVVLANILSFHSSAKPNGQLTKVEVLCVLKFSQTLIVRFQKLSGDPFRDYG